MRKTSISSQALLSSLRDAQGAVNEREGELAEFRSRLAAARRERDLLLELGRLRGIAESELQAIIGESSGRGNGTAPGVPSPRQPAGTMAPSGRADREERAELRATIAEVLFDHGKPMHIGELMSAVLERGATIPGRGEQANLISFISRHDEFMRPARGHYGLKEWAVSEYAPKSGPRKPSRR